MHVLWRENEPNFPSNCHHAIKSLDSLLRGQHKQPDMCTQYCAVIDGYLKVGTLVVVPPQELEKPHRYLPQFAVSKSSDPS